MKEKAHLLLSDAHLISPVHQHYVCLFFGKLLHLFGCFAGDPLPLWHLVTVQLILWQNKTHVYLHDGIRDFVDVVQMCFVWIPWLVSSCPWRAFCRRLSLGLRPDCRGKPATLSARGGRRENKMSCSGRSSKRCEMQKTFWLTSKSVTSIILKGLGLSFGHVSNIKTPAQWGNTSYVTLI